MKPESSKFKMKYCCPHFFKLKYFDNFELWVQSGAADALGIAMIVLPLYLG